MSTIPVSLTEKQFEEHVSPFLSKAKRSFICKIPLYKVFNYILYRLHTGCQWDRLRLIQLQENPKKEISWDAVYYHYRKWSRNHKIFKERLIYELYCKTWSM